MKIKGRYKLELQMLETMKLFDSTKKKKKKKKMSPQYCVPTGNDVLFINLTSHELKSRSQLY